MIHLYLLHEGGVSHFLVGTMESGQHAAYCMRNKGIVVTADGQRVHPAIV